MENTQNIVILAQGDQVYCEKAVYTATKKGLELTKLLDNKDGQNKIFANRKADGKSILPLAGNEKISYAGEGYLFVQVDPSIANSHVLVWNDGLQIALNERRTKDDFVIVDSQK